jgi:glycosyltransferase involved in cell wall biosynthesis
VQTWAGLARRGVTIAIPNWNHELLLPRAIDSAMRAVAQLRDGNVAAEVLVIDEGSRDGSPLLLRQLEALYFTQGLRVLSMGDTASLAASRNLALINARYRYVSFLDADNELIPENLPTFLRTLEETEAAMAYGNLLVRTPTSRCAMNLLSNESVQLKLFQTNYIDAFALVDRCQLLDLGGYEANYRVLEDHEMWLHLAVNGRKIVFVPLVFGYYYVLPSSMVAMSGNKAMEAASANQRIYDQLQARSRLPLNTNLLRFHPALGYF